MMPPIFFIAGGASAAPTPAGHDRFALVATLRLASDLFAHRLPSRTVTRLFPGEGVSDLMQNGVANRRLGIVAHEILRELDAALRIPAKAQRPLSPIPREYPTVQAVALHQLAGENFHLFKIHRFTNNHFLFTPATCAAIAQ